MSKTLPERGIIRRVWLILCDHSVAGVWRTRREAEEVLRFRRENSVELIEHFVMGPYVLQRGKRR